MVAVSVSRKYANGTDVFVFRGKNISGGRGRSEIFGESSLVAAMIARVSNYSDPFDPHQTLSCLIARTRASSSAVVVYTFGVTRTPLTPGRSIAAVNIP